MTAPAYRLLPPVAQSPLPSEAFQRWTLPDNENWAEFYRIPSGILLRFAGLADFSISPNGRAVSGVPAPDASGNTVEHLYLNQVLPLALSAQGRLALHASAVAIEGSAVAFLAPSGRGKSTLAAAFAKRGVPFLTDDGLILEQCGEEFMVQPGHPSVRLWDDSARPLVGNFQGPVLNADYTSKSRFLAGDCFVHCTMPKPLRAVFFLSPVDSALIDIVPLHAADCCLELLKHSFHLDVEDRGRLRGHFDHISRLSAAVPGFRLGYERSYDELEHTCQTLVEFVRKLAT